MVLPILAFVVIAWLTGAGVGYIKGRPVSNWNGGAPQPSTTQAPASTPNATPQVTPAASTTPSH
jgi:hypothetical protein